MNRIILNETSYFGAGCRSVIAAEASRRGFKKAFFVSVALLLICGLGYPLLMTGLAQVIFPNQANGSLIMENGQAVGSKLVGQDFTENYFMKCRPSAVNYNTYTREQADSGEYGGVGSGSNNYAPSNPDLKARVEADLAAFLETNPQIKAEEIPTDLLTASGSGLDPHISPESAKVQLPALVDATGLSLETLENIVSANSEGKAAGIFGEERVNVLGVNLEIARQIGIIQE